MRLSLNKVLTYVKFIPFGIRLIGYSQDLSKYPGLIPGYNNSNPRYSSSICRHYSAKMAVVSYDNDNVFSKILDGTIPAYKIFETEHCIAILDAFPATPGHSLLIPKARVASCLDMDEEIAINVLKELPRLCKAVQKATKCDGVNVIQNSGSAAGQVVFHAHFHVVPRYKNDGLFKQFKSASSMITQAEASETLEKLKSCL